MTKAGFERSDEKFSDTLGRAGALIGSLPRSPTIYLLSAAWRSYREGVFWYRKIYQSRKLVVSAGGLEQDPLKDLRLDADTIRYTAVVHWRKAIEYTRRAEQSLPGRLGAPE